MLAAIQLHGSTVGERFGAAVPVSPVGPSENDHWTAFDLLVGAPHRTVGGQLKAGAIAITS